jgi:hypothetical protein
MKQHSRSIQYGKDNWMASHESWGKDRRAERSRDCRNYWKPLSHNFLLNLNLAIFSLRLFTSQTSFYREIKKYWSGYSLWI